MRKHLARYGEWWWVPLLYTLAVWWIYRDLWHQHGIATGFGWDAIDSYGPDLQYQGDDLASGHYSLWNPYDKGGYPLIADPQYDRYYPFSWLFVAWGALFGPSWWLIQIKVLAHHVVGAAMMHLFLRSRGLSRRAAIAGGLMLIASAPLLDHKASNIIWPLMWVPLVWLSIDAAMAAPSWRRGAGMAAAFGLCITAGSPPGLFYSGLLVGGYATWRFAFAMLDRDKRSRRMIACVATAGVLVTLTLCLTTIPAQTLVQLGSRWRWQPEAQFPFALSLPWAPAMRGALVRAAGLGEMYMGAIACTVALCALVVRPRFDAKIAILWALLAAIALVLCGGENTKLLPWLVHHVPGFGLLRIPGRYKLVAAWAIAPAVGYGIAALESAEGRARWRAVIAAAASVVVSVILVENYLQENTSRPAWWSIAVACIAAAFVIATVFTPMRWRGQVVAAIGIAILLDAPSFTITDERLPASDARRTHEHDEAVLDQLVGIHDRWRIFDEFLIGERVGVRHRVRDFRGYPAVDPLSQMRYVDVLDWSKKHPALLAEYNVRYVLKGMHFRHADTLSFVQMPDPAYVSRGAGIWEAVDPAPLVMWYARYDVVAKPRAILDRVLEIGSQGRTRCVLEPGEAAHLPQDDGVALDDSRAGELESYETDEIVTTIDAPTSGVVVLNELAYPGWEVSVDDEPAQILRANYILRAVYVRAGHHRITWTFRPRGYRWLVDGYLVVWLVIVAAFATRKRSRRELGRAASSWVRRRNSRRSAPRRSSPEAEAPDVRER